MRNILAATITAFLASSPSLVNAGPILNGSFESGDLTGFLGLGNVTVVTSTMTHDDSEVVPTDGQYMAVINPGPVEIPPAIREENGTTWEQLADGLVTQLNLEPGQTFSFDWRFIGNDYSPFNDVAVFITELDTIFLSQIADVGDFGSTPWQTFHYTVAGGYHGLIAWGVGNQGDNLLPSQLAIDRLSVPEPASIALVSLGLFAMGAFGRRQNPAPGI